MTENIEALQPVQATPFTRDVQAVMPSRFASPINISFEEKKSKQQTAEHGPKANKESPPPDAGKLASPASVVPVTGDRKAVVVDYAYGLGGILYLIYSYVVSNGGLRFRVYLHFAIY